MPLVSLELNAPKELVAEPIIWRLGRLFNVVTNIRRARITEDYGYVLLSVEGSTEEVTQTKDYLRSLGLLNDGETGTAPRASVPPEDSVVQSNTIYVRVATVNAAQGHVPTLYRAGKEVNAVINVEFAAFDEEEGGAMELSISGPLGEVQRAIAYLHTTGIHVNPRQRSVSDNGNL